jgi:Na+-translocating ferredoxin:NAD+ oxidoreductase subunit B
MAPSRAEPAAPVMRRHSRATSVPSAHVIAVVDQERCSACGACISACRSGAISLGDVAGVDAAVCIGCGVCVSECPSDALSLDVIALHGGTTG